MPAAESDLRDLLRAVVRSGGLILVVTILGGGAAYLVARWLPKKYTVVTQVAVTQPVVATDIDPSSSITPKLPDAKALQDLAGAADLIPALEAASDARWRVTAMGNAAVRLDLTDSNPEHAAALANAWAQSLAARLNGLFGIDPPRIAGLERELTLLESNAVAAGQAFVEFLPASRLDGLQAGYAGATNTLQELHAKMAKLDLLAGDARALLAGWAGREANERLPVGDALAVVTLQQRAAGAQPVAQLPAVPADAYTVGSARSVVTYLIEAVTTQRKDVEATLPVWEEKVATLSGQVEAALQKQSELKRRHETAEQAYQSLARQLQEARLLVALNGPTARQPAAAVAPRVASSPRPKVNTVLGALLGFMLAVVFVAGRQWWRGPGQA